MAATRKQAGRVDIETRDERERGTKEGSSQLSYREPSTDTTSVPCPSTTGTSKDDDSAPRCTLGGGRERRGGTQLIAAAPLGGDRPPTLACLVFGRSTDD